jgi:hypothetical protein
MKSPFSHQTLPIKKSRQIRAPVAEEPPDAGAAAKTESGPPAPSCGGA